MEQRIIKFRAWDIPSQSMVENVTDLKKADIYEQPLMQWTGLNDVHGKPIFEGDIVSWGVNRGVVEMIKGSWMYTEFLGVDHQVEIVGNVYQNPELTNQ